MQKRGSECHYTQKELLHLQEQYKKEVTAWIWWVVGLARARDHAPARTRDEVPYAGRTYEL